MLLVMFHLYTKRDSRIAYYSDEMYDILAEPLAGTSTDPTLPATSRVFFAGEHTYRSDPATLQVIRPYKKQRFFRELS